MTTKEYFKTWKQAKLHFNNFVRNYNLSERRV
jgi:hypothetical protein